MSKVKGKTLVRILAEALKEWPECKFGCDSITQDKDGCLNSTDTGKQPEFVDGSLWSGFASTWIEFCGEVVRKELASDYKTAIVTRTQWEAERAKLSKPKASAHGWIRNRGRSGVCPAEPSQVIEVRDRDGDVYEVEAIALRWNHIGSGGDIMAWRSISAEQSSAEKASDARVEKSASTEPGHAEMPAAKYFDGPLQWRDRITEIDLTVEALEEERASLVQRLADEGLQLIERK